MVITVLVMMGVTGICKIYERYGTVFTAGMGFTFYGSVLTGFMGQC